MQRIHEAALTILADVGMRVESERALHYLSGAGCQVDRAELRGQVPSGGGPDVCRPDAPGTMATLSAGRSG